MAAADSTTAHVIDLHCVNHSTFGEKAALPVKELTHPQRLEKVLEECLVGPLAVAKEEHRGFRNMACRQLWKEY